MSIRRPRFPKRRSAPATDLTGSPRKAEPLGKPPAIERDAKGWPTVFWSLAGSAPEFDVGDRKH
jgi:hypothetical protein